MSNSYDSVTPKRLPVVRLVLLATAVCAIFAASVSAAQSPDLSTVVAQAAIVAPVAQAPAPVPTSVAVAQTPEVPSEELLELVAELEARDEQIAALQEQLAVLRQEHLSNLIAADEAAASGSSSSFAAKTRITPEENAIAMEQWRSGYTLGGGQNLAAFENTILPCESGTQPNPDIAVGRTDDWGRSQINRPTWKTRFETLTGADFETHIVNPVLNGFMAAHVEQEQGLTAWTCWRKR